MDAEETEPCPHHQGVRLSDKIGLFAGRELNRRNQRAAGGCNTALGRPGQIIVRADQLGARVDKAYRLGDLIQIIGRGLSDHHIVRIHIVIGDALVVERIQNTVLADHIGRAAGRLPIQKVCGRERTCVKVRLIDLKPHALQFLLQLLRRVLARICEKQKVLVLAKHPLHKFPHARQNPVAVINHAVHVADKSLFIPQCCLHNNSFPYNNTRAPLMRGYLLAQTPCFLPQCACIL